MLYKRVLKPFLFCFNPEKVHHFCVAMGQFIGNHEMTRSLVDWAYGYNGKDISKVVDGLRYRTPVILAAGFDYNGRLTRILPHVGFGGVEVGSVTARECQGNPTPQLQRLPNEKSIIVNKGLRNDGVDKIIQRLKTTPREKDFVIGISIARTNDKRGASTEEGVADYAYSFRKLNEEEVGDYYTINISCPNAYGSEIFIDPKLLPTLLSALEKIPCIKPVYIKMPINLVWEKFKELIEIIKDFRIKGLVIGNLNKDYGILDEQNRPKKYCGGLSGLPCRDLSTQLIQRVREHYKNRFTIFGVGGIASPIDAANKFEAGADLLQLITGMIYEGPSLIKRICASISRPPKH